jgi:hypothetical protein
MSLQNLPDANQPRSDESYDDFETRMIRALGATVGGDALTRALGYPSQDAFRKARHRGRLPVMTFEVEGRRGRFAMAIDIATWLWDQRSRMSPPASVGGRCRPSY